MGRVSKTTVSGPPRTPAYVVGIGGSAGSLKPLEELLAGLTLSTPIAIVVVTHRSPSMKGLVEILGRATKRPVRMAAEGDQLAAGVVYVLPADRELALTGGRVSLRRRRKGERLVAPISTMLRAIANDCKERSVGVILSGMGDDGASGLGVIRERLGTCFVQIPSSAEFDSMPAAAMAAGVADFVGTPAELAARIADLTAGAAEQPRRSYGRILEVVLERTGHDFRAYKQSTVARRIARRMTLGRVADESTYAALLARDVAEVEHLIADLLINVTQFFRDPAAFAKLGDALARHLRVRAGGGGIRAWVAGCATGEEAYSLAILICERWEEVHPGTRPRVQIYATDLDIVAIERARRGRYPRSIDADVSPARLARFFDEDGDGYRVKKALRETIVFAKHNVISDPPFTRLDVLTCRNVLIYLDLDLQRRLLPTFAYALAPGGLLALGLSETIDGMTGILTAVDAVNKIFERRETALVGRDLERAIAPRPTPESTSPREVVRSNALPDAITRTIVERVSPPVIVVDARGELLFASRRMGRYFEPPLGRSSLNVYAMAREGLAVPLRAAIGKAIARGKDVVQRDVHVKASTGTVSVDLAVWPLDAAFSGSALVAITEREEPRVPRGSKKAASRRGDTTAQLRRARAQLEAMVQEMGDSSELVRDANEDLQSLNEELQSANEELTTSKEEMQSMNEELLSLNAELQTTNEQLVTTNDDMRNLLNSTQIPTLFLDNELRLKRFTSQASRIARLIGTDIGRPVTDLTWNIEYSTLARDVADVLQTLVFKQAEVSASDGSVFTMHIHPYRTVDDVIDGVVLTFVEITQQKRALARETVTTRRELVRRVMHGWPGIAYVEEVGSGHVEAVSKASARLLGYPHDLLVGATTELWRTLRHAPKRGRGVEAHVIELECRNGTRIICRERQYVLARDAADAPTAILHTFRRVARGTP